MFDNRISIRIDDEEVAVLPPKLECSVEDLERALLKVCMAVDAVWSDVDGPFNRNLKGDLNW